MPLPQLRRVRWAVRATLALGVAASVTANILHAQENPISQAIAAWPPLALLLTVELISRVPVHRRVLAFARFAATAIIAGIAAWVSYWHMVGVAARYGETGASPYLLPLSVDGLIVVASICLVELGGRISAAETERATRLETERSPVTEAERPPAPTATNGAGPRVKAAATRATAVATGAKPATPQTTAGATGARPTATRATARAEPATAGAEPAATRARSGGQVPAKPSRPRRPVAETAALAAQIEADRPDLTEADLAQELGITLSRLRAVRRQARVPELAA
ncbi:DUF2637 domain-containing protein [Plantactinospora sp. GCM10030261]|uniref:DUF2637 domain-containing protein n=1 Tax=Plantactinospora sp. GCM10030261 TaxID=3273420 RepID=UPI0036066D15